MRIIYLFRCPGTGYSIEELFESVRRTVMQQTTIQAEAVALPFISRGVRSVWRNFRFLRQLDADIFHITGDVHYAALLLPASRTVLTIHDCILLQRNRRKPLRYTLLWLFWYYLPIRRAHVVTAVSDKTRHELIQLVGRVAQKVIIVPNGYDPIFEYQPALFQKSKPALLQIGTAPHKNLRRLLTAIEGMPCTLSIVGPLSVDQLAELTNRRIDYRHYDRISRSQMIRLYEACDIVTFVSTYEGFGMPILEANAVGRVVLTSALEPMKTLAGDAAHLVNPTDITAIREGIERLVHDDAYRQKLIEAGLKNAQRYMVTTCTDQYLSLYQKLLKTSLIPVSAT